MFCHGVCDGRVRGGGAGGGRASPLPPSPYVNPTSTSSERRACVMCKRGRALEARSPLSRGPACLLPQSYYASTHHTVNPPPASITSTSPPPLPHRRPWSSQASRRPRLPSASSGGRGGGCRCGLCARTAPNECQPFRLPMSTAQQRRARGVGRRSRRVVVGGVCGGGRQ